MSRGWYARLGTGGGMGEIKICLLLVVGIVSTDDGRDRLND